MPTAEDDQSMLSEQAESVISKGLTVVCSQCQALAGELCKKSDGQRLEYKGHLGMHLPRLIAARTVLSAKA